MARPTVEFPCGCVVNETSVIAMCLRHDRELREKALAERKAVDNWYSDIRRTIDELGK